MKKSIISILTMFFLTNTLLNAGIEKSINKTAKKAIHAVKKIDEYYITFYNNLTKTRQKVFICQAREINGVWNFDRKYCTIKFGGNHRFTGSGEYYVVRTATHVLRLNEKPITIKDALKKLNTTSKENIKKLYKMANQKPSNNKNIQTCQFLFNLRYFANTLPLYIDNMNGYESFGKRVL